MTARARDRLVRARRVRLLFGALVLVACLVVLLLTSLGTGETTEEDAALAAAALHADAAETARLAANARALRAARTLEFAVPPNAACSAVDAVYLWVNGSDARVAGAYAAVFGAGYVERGALRDVPTLRYSLRALATHAPFVRRVVLVTAGEVPAWLNASHPRVRVVPHAALFAPAAAAHLPTFSSNAIEAQLHRVPGIAPCWFYLNDDMAFGRPVRLADWLDPATGRQRLAFDAWTAPRPADARTNVWHASVAHSNTLLSEHYHCREKHEHHYEAHSVRLVQQRWLERVYETWKAEFDATATRRLRGPHDTALPFLYHNALVHEGAGVRDSALAGALARGTFTLDAGRVRATVRAWRRRRPVAWCLNDAAGEVRTAEDRARYTEAVRALEDELGAEFPLPAEFENVAPGEQVIPRSLAEYEARYGVPRGRHTALRGRLLRAAAVGVGVALIAYVAGIAWRRRRCADTADLFAGLAEKDHRV